MRNYLNFNLYRVVPYFYLAGLAALNWGLLKRKLKKKKKGMKKKKVLMSNSVWRDGCDVGGGGTKKAVTVYKKNWTA